MKPCCKVRNTAASPKEIPCKKPHQKEKAVVLICFDHFFFDPAVMLDILEVPDILDPAGPTDAGHAATKPVEVASDSQEQTEA